MDVPVNVPGRAIHREVLPVNVKVDSDSFLDMFLNSVNPIYQILKIDDIDPRVDNIIDKLYNMSV